MWKFACILSWIFFVIVMLLLLCFDSIEFSGVKRPRLLVSRDSYGNGVNEFAL